MSARTPIAAVKLFIALILLAAPSITCADYLPDELIIKMKPGKATQSAALNAVPGTKTIRHNKKHGLMRVKVRKGTELSKAMAEYRKNPSVAYVGPNHILKITTPYPNDPVYREGVDLYGIGWFSPPQWGLYNDGDNNGNGGTFRADIHAPEAWEITKGNPSIVIAVLDTGYNYNHPDMSGKLWTNPYETAGNGIDDDSNGFVDDVHGWDFVNSDNDPMDDYVQVDPLFGGVSEIHHGTFVSSVAAASTDNNEGIAGVAPLCPVLPAKVSDENGYGLESDVADAVYYALDHGVRVINMSLAGADDVPALAQAVEYAWQQGAMCVCASGNEGVSTPMYPAWYPHALSVGASNEDDVRCIPTTAGDWTQGGSNYGPTLDVMAPGTFILGATNAVEPNGYYPFPGTSAATPFVSGVAALIWSLHPDWTNSQVFYQILLTADDMAATGWDIETGWGRINAFRALSEPQRLYSRVSNVKPLGTSSRAVLRGAVLSTSSGEIPNRLYVQDTDGTSGICLDFSTGTVPAGLLEGDVVEVFGEMGQVNGERAFINPMVTKLMKGVAPKPVAMASSALGGGAFGLQWAVVDKRYPSPATMATGLNNIGKLITITGEVTFATYDYFYIDDGCNLDDGSGSLGGLGVYVHNGDLDRPALGSYAAVTGISSCEFSPGSQTYRRRILRPRRQSDIQTIAE